MKVLDVIWDSFVSLEDFPDYRLLIHVIFEKFQAPSSVDQKRLSVHELTFQYSHKGFNNFTVVMVRAIFGYIIELIKGYIISLTQSFQYIHYITWQMFFCQLERGQLFQNLDRIELIIKRLVQKLFSWYPRPLLIDFLNSNFFSDSLGFLSEW